MRNAANSYTDHTHYGPMINNIHFNLMRSCVMFSSGPIQVLCDIVAPPTHTRTHKRRIFNYIRSVIGHRKNTASAGLIRGRVCVCCRRIFHMNVSLCVQQTLNVNRYIIATMRCPHEPERCLSLRCDVLCATLPPMMWYMLNVDTQKQSQKNAQQTTHSGVTNSINIMLEKCYV